jgi:protein ImuB
LALLDLESHPPSAAIERVAIVIDPTPGRVVQHTLFARPQLTPEQLSTLLARLGAVMGQDRVGAPATVDSYRPGIFAMKPFTQPAVGSQQSYPSQPLASTLHPPTAVLRRCRQPVPGRVAADASDRPVRVTTDRRGFAGGTVVRSSGPWRTSGEWWITGPGKAGESSKTGREDNASEAGPESSQPHQSSPPPRSQRGWDRDEWDVTLNDGAAYRIFMDRVTGGWYIDAIYD